MRGKSGIRLAGIEKYIVNVLVALVLSTGLIFGVFFALVQAERANIDNTGETKAVRVAREVRYYLSESENIIRLESHAMNRLMTNDASREEMEEYLISQSEIIMGLVDGNATGIYGLFGDEYIDGVGFVPDDDYVPQTRPWYKAAIEADGKVGLSEPYTDAQTGSTMISVSHMLYDMKSVVALDIYLDGIQRTTEEIVRSSKSESPEKRGGLFSILPKPKQRHQDMAMIIDGKGFVVAHSNASEVGHNYLEQEDTVGRAIADRLYVANGASFEVKAEDQSYMIFSERINTDWYAVMAIDLDEFLRPLRTIFTISVLVWLLTLAFMANMFVRINQRRTEVEDLNRQLESVAGIFATAHVIDLESDTFREIRTSMDLSMLLGDKEDNAKAIMTGLMDYMTAETSKESVMAFIDFNTLDERMAEVDTITLEFLSSRNRWCRGRFVAVDRHGDGRLRRVLWLIEIIDEERRQRDRLLYLSETDRMTGINNRGSGELKISRMLESGLGGMFCLLDADHFKSVNDTFGHGVGDKVIIEIANCLKNSFRENDVVMRLGGDEFAAFAPFVHDEEAGQIVLERFMERISKIRIREMGDRVIEVSIGAAFYQEGDNFGFEELYRRADRCTYESKKVKGSRATYYHSDKEI